MNAERENILDYAKRNAYRLSPKASVPLYYQLFRLCERFIYEQHLRSGERFPSESEIAESFSVSRPTAHHAIQELLDRGWLRRTRGRGTFVADGVYAELTLAVEELSFPDQCFGTGRKSTRVVDLREEEPSRQIQKALRLQEEDRVTHLRRLRCIDDRPVLLSDSWFSASRFPGFAETMLVDGSLARALQQQYGTPIARCERRLEASEALAQEVADHLGTPILSPILVVHSLAYGSRSDPVVLTQAYAREGVTFRSDVHPSSGACSAPTQVGRASINRRS